MAEGMMQVSCPGCQSVLSVPHDSGEEFRCEICGATFRVPNEPLHQDAVFRDPGPLPPHLQDAGATESPAPAVLPAELPAEKTALRRRRRRPEILLFVLLGGTILAGAVVSVLFWQGARFERKRSDSSDTATEDATTKSVSAVDSGWSDPSKTLLRERMTLRLVSFRFGEIRGKDERGAVVISDESNFLIIKLRLKNLGPSRRYRSWYGNTFARQGTKVAAQLADDAGQSYRINVFEHVDRIEGAVAEADMPTKATVDDVIVFMIPSDVDRSSIRFFRLALPGEAYGGKGEFRFKIPRDLIRGF